MLFEAYKLLDADKKGYLDLHTLFNLLKNFGYVFIITLLIRISFSKSHIKDMNDFIEQNEVQFLDMSKVDPTADQDGKQTKSQYKSRKFYYEKYITKVMNDNKKHFDSLMGEFREFADRKENRDVKDTVIVEKK